MQLFYNSKISVNTNNFVFDKGESKHIIRVLRKKENDRLFISNGLGYLFMAKITNANDKKCAIEIISFESKAKEWNYNLHIAIAPTKLNDRFEWFLEKATEIGIDEITPIICENSERKVVKKDRFEKILISAMKQSLKYQLPKLNEAVQFSEFIKNHKGDCKLIAHCENLDKKSLKSQVESSQAITVIIGPEGDFSSKEIVHALEHNFIPLSLGKSRLRTETAGVVVCNSISVIKNEM